MTRLYRSAARGLYLAAAVSLVATVPALAQNNSAASGNAPSDTSKPGTMALGDKAPNGSLTKSHDDWRSANSWVQPLHSTRETASGRLMTFL